MWSIVHKEYRQRARGMATLGLILSYTLILSAVVFFVYLSTYGGLIQGNIQSSSVGLAMGIASFITQMILALLLALSLNASTIASEKDQETFDLLNLTLFKSYEIVLGKFLSSTGFLFILVITAVPVYALAFTFGGMNLDVLWRLAALVVGMTLFIGSLGLLFSLVSEDVRTALGRSFFVLIILVAITMVFGWSLFGSFSSQPPNVLTYWLGALSLVLSPVWAAIDVFNPIAPQIQWQSGPSTLVVQMIQGGHLWIWASLMQVALCLITLGATALAYPRYRASRLGGVA